MGITIDPYKTMARPAAQPKQPGNAPKPANRPARRVYHIRQPLARDKAIGPGGNTMDYTTVLAKAEQTLEQRKDRSAWDRGVTAYAADMLQQIAAYYTGGYISADDLATWTTAEAAALNGARDWSEYSWGGSALVYDGDIAAALCTPSELKKTRNGERRPNSHEEWLDTQARALFQAANRIVSRVRMLAEEAAA